MASVSETKIETITVAMKREDVREAIISAARKEVQGSHLSYAPDERWTPQLIEDGYGGFTVYFRKAEPKAAAKVAQPIHAM